MTRISRLISSHLNCLKWDGCSLRFDASKTKRHSPEEYADWVYFMSWSQEDRLRLAHRVFKPFAEYIKKEVTNWSAKASDGDAEWNCFLLDLHYELSHAIGGALSLPTRWYVEVRKG